ncbi:MAG: hypothetical protein HC903_05610 [Methylacidiphilales bacterium]|nr:hypothetical protein [Candidatus Methylacidiphilales bacterium]NJR19295.1 hypothetical protein [Calothrix sp. CSU_2_0]
MQEIIHNQLETTSEYLYNLLQSIKKRPGMYLGKCSISRLRSFLDGYMLARQEFGLPTTQEETDFDKFQEWIQERFKIESSHGWDSIILFYSADERDALDNFFELVEKFRNGEKASRN